MKPPATPVRKSTVPAPPATTVPTPLDSRVLLGAQDEVHIAHGGDIYRLRRTRQDKLILTK